MSQWHKIPWPLRHLLSHSVLFTLSMGLEVKELRTLWPLTSEARWQQHLKCVSGDVGNERMTYKRQNEATLLLPGLATPKWVLSRVSNFSGWNRWHIIDRDRFIFKELAHVIEEAEIRRAGWKLRQLILQFWCRISSPRNLRFCLFVCF